ncbi:MAG: FHA domain-containing protein [Blastocatellia bacterium]
MSSELILVWNDGSGNEQEFAVSSRFTIGRETDNDLVVADAGLSRRHALIENYDGLAQITDRDSRNGTFVNGVRVNGTSPLRDGDVITFGSDQELRVRLSVPGAAPVASFSPVRPVSRVQPEPRRTSSLSPPLLAGISLFVLLVGSVAAYLVTHRDRPPENSDLVTPTPIESGSPVVTSTPPVSPSSADDAELKAISSRANTLLALVSNDQNPYIFPPQALSDIQQQIRQYRNAPEPLSQALRDLHSRGAKLAGEIRQNSSLSPQLVFGVALAETDGGKGNVLAVAQSAYQKLNFLYATFGIDKADKTLILVAACQIGTGNEKSHPLLAKKSALPLNEQTVWSLRRYQKIEPATYQFVIRFLALGVIAQSPAEFGFKDAPALVF